MKNKNYFPVILSIITAMLLNSSSCSRRTNQIISDSDKQVGGRCEDCEIFYVDIPNNLDWQTTIGLPGDEERN